MLWIRIRIIWVTWIRIRMKNNTGTDPDLFPRPHPHQIKIRIRIRINVISWIWNRIRINSQMTSQNVWNMSLFGHFFKGLSLYLAARIWIRIRIMVKSRTRIYIK
jgi:hypothetical protein